MRIGPKWSISYVKFTDWLDFHGFVDHWRTCYHILREVSRKILEKLKKTCNCFGLKGLDMFTEGAPSVYYPKG
jgi:hypothetical protein